jgi:colanic acid biosynthesis protein WcaH
MYSLHIEPRQTAVICESLDAFIHNKNAFDATRGRMEVNDRRIPDEQFEAFLDEMPQVCVELVLDTEDGVFLARRTGKPRLWFWPGSRLYKGETLSAAAHRVGREELGIEVNLVERLGVHSHFWDSTETDEGVSRHTVNIVYRAAPADEAYDIHLDEQHADYRFLSEREPGLHEHVQEYIEQYDLLYRST